MTGIYYFLSTAIEYIIIQLLQTILRIPNLYVVLCGFEWGTLRLLPSVYAGTNEKILFQTKLQVKILTLCNVICYHIIFVYIHTMHTVIWLTYDSVFFLLVPVQPFVRLVRSYILQLRSRGSIKSSQTADFLTESPSPETTVSFPL